MFHGFQENEVQLLLFLCVFQLYYVLLGLKLLLLKIYALQLTSKNFVIRTRLPKIDSRQNSNIKLFSFISNIQTPLFLSLISCSGKLLTRYIIHWQMVHIGLNELQCLIFYLLYCFFIQLATQLKQVRSSNTQTTLRLFQCFFQYSLHVLNAFK